MDCGLCNLQNWRRSDEATLIAAADNRRVWRNLHHRFSHPYTQSDARNWFSLLAAMPEPTHWTIEVDGIAVGPPRSDCPLDDAMNDTLEGLLRELERFGQDNDAATAERPRRMLNITRDTGEFLAVLVRATNTRRVLEIGTSNGYSTLWLALAAKATGGRVTTVELSEFKIGLATANFDRSGLADAIEQVCGEADAFLKAAPDSQYDLVFLDSERPEYPGWWPDIRRVLRPGGLLVVDNALSHVAEMAPFVALVEADGAFTSCTVPVGNGEFMAVKAA